MYREFIDELSYLCRKYQVIIEENAGTIELNGTEGQVWIKWKTFPNEENKHEGEFVNIQEYQKVGKD